MKDKISNIISIALIYGIFSILVLVPLTFSSIAMYKVFEIQETQRIILSNQREILANQQIVHDVLDAIVEAQSLKYKIIKE